MAEETDIPQQQQRKALQLPTIDNSQSGSLLKPPIPYPTKETRSRSFELPRKQHGVNIKTDEITIIEEYNLHAKKTRPSIKQWSKSHYGHSIVNTQNHYLRPSIQMRNSFVKSVSSFSSMYSHFAGEDFESHHQNQNQNRSAAASVIEKYNRSNSIFKEEKEDQERRNDLAVSSLYLDKKPATYDDSITDDIEEKYKKDEEDSDGIPKATVGKAMFMFLKAFVGSGVLFLPKAFENGGLALSPILMVVIAGISLFATLRLVSTQRIVGGSYGDIGGILLGRPVRYLVLFFIVISQIGFVCSYFVFISGNLVNIGDVLSHCTANIEQKYYIWFPVVFIVPLAMIRHITRLSFAAIVADVFILFGLVSCLYFTSYELKTHGIGPEVKAINPANFALMIGTATFSFEGVGLIIPIAESMKQPEKFPFVVTVGMSIICAVYILIGATSYMAYGNQIQAAVVYNFPRDNPLTITVQLLYSVAIVLTAPFMLFPATKILENGIFQKSGNEDRMTKWMKNLFRFFLVCLSAGVAFAIGGENLDIFVSLVGSIACVPLCFIFPGMFHYKVAKCLKDKVFDMLLIVFGISTMVYTIYTTLVSVLNPLPSVFALPPFCPSRQ